MNEVIDYQKPKGWLDRMRELGENESFTTTYNRLNTISAMKSRQMKWEYPDRVYELKKDGDNLIVTRLEDKE